MQALRRNILSCGAGPAPCRSEAARAPSCWDATHALAKAHGCHPTFSGHGRPAGHLEGECCCTSRCRGSACIHVAAFSLSQMSLRNCGQAGSCAAGYVWQWSSQVVSGLSRRFYLRLPSLAGPHIDLSCAYDLWVERTRTLPAEGLQLKPYSMTVLKPRSIALLLGPAGDVWAGWTGTPPHGGAACGT